MVTQGQMYATAEPFGAVTETPKALNKEIYLRLLDHFCSGVLEFFGTRRLRGFSGTGPSFFQRSWRSVQMCCADSNPFGVRSQLIPALKLETRTCRLKFKPPEI